MKTLLFAAVMLLILAFLLMIVPGFRFSIILCIGGAALCVLFYLLHRFPFPTAHLIRTVTLIALVVGVAAAAVTSSFILRAAHPKDTAACRYVIVLGAGVNGTEPSLTLSERIHAAYEYLSHNPEAIAVLSGGQGPNEDITEAACMYRELTQMGIRPEQLLLEEASTSTIENLQFSIALLEDQMGLRPGKVGIISSEYHLFRAGQFAKELDVKAVGIPAKTTWLPLRINYYLREIAAVWKYLVLGP